MSPFSPLLFLALASVSYAQDGSDAPVFEPLFSSGEVTFTVIERATKGTEVGLVRAQGLPQETVLYGVEDLGDEWEGAFEIGSSSGEIAVGPNGVNILVISGAPLSIRFGVFAYYESAGLHGNRSILSVTVQIEDVNDSPYFEDIDTQIFVESVAVGDVLRRITATDNDLGVNAALEYSLHQISRPGGDTEDSFSIHRYTGDLTVTMSLSVGFEYQLTITATDEGEPSLSASINVTIVDDPVPPVFDQRVYEVELLEFTNKTRVSVVNVSATATDEDEVVYSIIKWSPAPEGLNFTVGSSTGYLYATGTLDRETFSRYTITVEAYAYVGAPSEATVVLHVGDVNEPPQFSRSHYSAAVSEGAELGYLFYSSVMATDRDKGLSNSEVTYS
ncbi:Cadherin-99C [Geodia barretti]|uniref:Cadherin-99C n=1 Tax=Geodia barretti TaxID=519541 RepID=A0AA35QW25_GEOBA|nr:Cadherin-99C [Geodia barretti]